MATKIEIRNYANRNNVSMAEAKQHFINLASSPTATIKIIALRHCEDGNQEFAVFEAAVNENHKRNKDDLLRAICLTDWAHTPPCQPIIDYLVKTNTYNTIKMLVNTNVYAYVINFHEVDKEMTAIKGEKRFSCRVIHTISDKAEWDKYTAQLEKDINDDPNMSLQKGMLNVVDFAF